MKYSIIAILMTMCLFWEGHAAALLPPHVKDIVTFIFIKNPNGEIVPVGTGFFIGVKSEYDPHRSFCYLVTAKHVLRDKNGEYYNSIYIRLNKKNGDSEMGELSLKDRGIVFFHKDFDVDLAVIPFLPDQNKFDFKILPSELLTTKEMFKKYDIEEGDEMFFTGLFTPYVGAKRNYPVFRFGRLAMVTDEKIPVNGDLVDIYLMETQSFGGNSGSPVFFYLDPSRNPNSSVPGGQRILLLAGIMYGAFDEGDPIKTLNTNDVSLSVQNLGISAVIPAYKLYEILFSDELKHLRKLGSVKNSVVPQRLGGAGARLRL